MKGQHYFDMRGRTWVTRGKPAQNVPLWHYTQLMKSGLGPNCRQLFETGEWQAIPNCPGRFVLRGARADLGIEELVGSLATQHEFNVARARDTVIIVRLVDGGLISYRRADGSFLHTLNTNDGFHRKLRDLEIALPDGPIESGQ